MQTEMNGMTIDYGPFLFALPIKAKVEKILLNKEMWNSTPKDSKNLYGYNMFPKFSEVSKIQKSLTLGILVEPKFLC